MTFEYIRRSENIILPYDLTGLTEELKTRAKIELHEDDETRTQSLKMLRSMIKEETELTCPNDDAFLMQFLRARKFDLKKSFTVLKNYFLVRVKYPEIFHNLDFQTVQKTMDENILGFLPYRDHEGSVILIIQAGKWNPTEVTMTEVMRTLTAGLVQAIEGPATQIAGFKVIVDFKGFGLKHLPHVSATYLWLLADALQNCFPGRFRAVHIVNEGHLFSYIWAVLKTLLTKKLKERFHFHGKNMYKLHKHLSPSILPEEYEGELGPFDNTEWAKKMHQVESFITESFKYGYQKKMRVAN